VNKRIYPVSKVYSLFRIQNYGQSPECNLPTLETFKIEDNTVLLPYYASNILVSLVIPSVSMTAPHKACYLFSWITLLQNVVTNFKEHSFWETNSYQGSQSVPRYLWDPVEKSPQIFSILTQMNHVYMIKFYSFKIHFNIILPSMRRSSKWPL
jgi:hypothetical protein